MLRIMLEINVCAPKIYELLIIEHLNTLESVNDVIEIFWKIPTQCSWNIWSIYHSSTRLDFKGNIIQSYITAITTTFGSNEEYLNQINKYFNKENIEAILYLF
jgi:hypothetical protein